MKAELSAAKERIAALEETAFAALAREHAGQGDTLLIQGPMRADSVRRLADTVGRACGGLAAVFAGEDGKGYLYALVRDGGTVDVREMNAALRGRGGGRGGFAQGSVQADRAEIAAYFR